MPKKRRKLSREMEQEIDQAKRKVELISAKINDIEEEEILFEYQSAFQLTKNEYLNLYALYASYGINDESQTSLDNYKRYLTEFEGEYEI